jgi:hypothetical protein
MDDPSKRCSLNVDIRLLQCFSAEGVQGSKAHFVYFGIPLKL